jgi:hypothetical protein
MSEKRSRWEWLERMALFIGMILGITAFGWQLQERLATRRESISVALVGLSPVADSLWILDTDVMNWGYRPVNIRSVRIGPKVYFLKQDDSGHVGLTGAPFEFYSDSAGVLLLEANHSRRFRSGPLTGKAVRNVLQSVTPIVVETVRGEYQPEVNHSAILQLVQVYQHIGPNGHTLFPYAPGDSFVPLPPLRRSRPGRVMSRP